VLIDFLSFFRVVGSSMRKPGVLCVLQCVAVRCSAKACRCGRLMLYRCCSVLQCFALCYRVLQSLQCAALCCSAMHCVAVCWCSVAEACCLVCATLLNPNSVCCTVVHCVASVAVCCIYAHLYVQHTSLSTQCVAVCYSVLQCATVCCSVMQCDAMYCSVLQFVQIVLFVVSYLDVVCGMGGQGQKA